MLNSNSKKILVLLSLLIFTLSGFYMEAQITISQEVFTNYIGNQTREVLYETDLDIDGQLADIKLAVGPNQIWDFSNLNFIDSTVSIYEVMEIDSNNPFLENPELANSNYLSKVTLLPGSGGVEDTLSTYLFTTFENGKWTTNGSFTMIDLDLDGVLDSALQFYIPPFLEVPFPVTSTSVWTDSTDLVTVFDGMEFVGGIQIDTSWVQGYGTLITPYGTAEALRIHNKNITKNPFSPIVDVSNDYDFVIASDMFSASIVVEDGRAFHTVRKVVGGPSNNFDFPDLKFIVSTVMPNPFDNLLMVNITLPKSAEVEFRLISANAQISELLQTTKLRQGTQKLEFPIANIPSGLYYLQARSGQFIQHVSVTKI